MTDRHDDNGNLLEYTVSLTREGAYQCSCKAWIFQRKHLLDGRKAEPWEIPNGHCKHIVEVIHERELHRDDIEAGRPVIVHTDEYDIELVQNGRVSAFINGFKK
jgi:hypothetical protein